MPNLGLKVVNWQIRWKRKDELFFVNFWPAFHPVCKWNIASFEQVLNVLDQSLDRFVGFHYRVKVG